MGFTPEQEQTLLSGQATLLEEMRRARELADREARARRIAMWATGAAALFAAVKLGVVALPAWRRRKAQEAGT